MGKMIGGLAVTTAMFGLAACASYPSEPRYSTRADPNAWVGPQPAYPPAPGATPGTPAPIEEAPPPRTAPIDAIEGGALPSAGSGSGAGASAPRPSETQHTSGPALVPSPAAGALAYSVQQGDTLSGVARRFRTPVRTLIELNGLTPDGGVRAGQRVILPAGAVDIGSDPYATGPAPTALPAGTVPARPAPVVTPPPAPPVTRPAPAPVQPTPAQPTAPAPATGAPATGAPPTGALAFQWPLRGEVVRRFGPVALGERNNGINIAGAAGATVAASATGRVAYVGDSIPGHGLTVIVVHRDGYRTVYSHLGSATVDDGDDVRAGQQVGTVGTSAGDGRPSVHFEIRKVEGDNPQAIDPMTVLPR